MILNEARNLIILFLILTPLIGILSLYSLKYHIALYKTSSLNVEIFLSRFIFPLRWFYSTFSPKFHDDKNDPSSDEIRISLLYKQRIMISILPTLFIGASVIVIFRLLPSGDPIILRYVLVLTILPFCLIKAWRFGHRLKEIRTD
jgi:hypothetical protein